MERGAWRSAAAYADLLNASAEDIAWEFLRRNPDYRRRVREGGDAFARDWDLSFRRRSDGYGR